MKKSVCPLSLEHRSSLCKPLYVVLPYPFSPCFHFYIYHGPKSNISEPSSVPGGALRVCKGYRQVSRGCVWWALWEAGGLKHSLMRNWLTVVADWGHERLNANISLCGFISDLFFLIYISL